MSTRDSAEKALVATLTAERGRRGLSMREVARASGVSPSCVHSWEHGTRAPSLDNLRAWAASLGYDLILTTFRNSEWPLPSDAQPLGPNEHQRGPCACGDTHDYGEFL